MITGDSESTAQVIAKEVGIGNVLANVYFFEKTLDLNDASTFTIIS